MPRVTRLAGYATEGFENLLNFNEQSHLKKPRCSPVGGTTLVMHVNIWSI